MLISHREGYTEESELVLKTAEHSIEELIGTVLEFILPKIIIVSE